MTSLKLISLLRLINMTEKESEARQHRNVLLRKNVDSINPTRWELLSNEDKNKLIAYRQALLDVPQQSGFPETINWPVMPVI